MVKSKLHKHNNLQNNFEVLFLPLRVYHVLIFRNRSVTPNGDWFNPSGLIPGEQPFDPKQQQGHNQPNLAYNQQDFTYNQQRQGFNQSDVGYNRNYNQKSGGYNQPRSSYNQNVLDFNNQQYLGSNTWNRNIPNQSTTGTDQNMTT